MLERQEEFDFDRWLEGFVAPGSKRALSLSLVLAVLAYQLLPVVSFPWEAGAEIRHTTVPADSFSVWARILFAAYVLSVSYCLVISRPKDLKQFFLALFAASGFWLSISFELGFHKNIGPGGATFLLLFGVPIPVWLSCLFCVNRCEVVTNSVRKQSDLPPVHEALEAELNIVGSAEYEAYTREKNKDVSR